MLLAIPKRPAAAIQWQTDGNRNFRFEVEIIADAGELGLRMFGRASAALPDGNVSLGLLGESAGVWRAFERLDWRPSRPHSNRAVGPTEWRFTLMHGSHHHAADHNAQLAMGLTEAVASGLPVAVPMSGDPSWPDLLRYAAAAWNVSDLADIPLPPW